MGIQGRELFQFQTGSMRSPRLRLWEFREENCFNSKRVRLEGEDQFDTLLNFEQFSVQDITDVGVGSPNPLSLG
jgi:hypothetical protein